MTFNQIKYFIKLAECLSFTEAAKCLFITQPALSRQIAVMEEEVGTPLFVRDRKKLKLTPGGLVLYNRLPRLLESFEDAVSAAASANQGYEGSLKVGILDIYDISDLFAHQLEEFQKQNPAIRISLERFPLGVLPKKLYDGSLDLILTYHFSLYDQPDLLTSVIQTFDSCIMLNRSHPLADRETLLLEDLRDETFVQLGAVFSEEGYQYLLYLCSRCGFTPNIRQVDKMEDVLLWLQAGSGVAITTNRTIEKYNPDVIIRPIDMPEAQNHEVCMAWYKNNYNPAIAIFMEMLEHSLKEIREWQEKRTGSTRVYARYAREKQEEREAPDIC